MYESQPTCQCRELKITNTDSRFVYVYTIDYTSNLKFLRPKLAIDCTASGNFTLISRYVADDFLYGYLEEAGSEIFEPDPSRSCQGVRDTTFSEIAKFI